MNDGKVTLDRLKYLLHYDPETGIFTRLVESGGQMPGTVTTGFHGGKRYGRISIDKVRYFSHRLAWFYVYGRFPNGEIDHRNRDRRDNRISNLREVTHGQNAQNAVRVPPRSGHTGVDFQRGRWRARISYQKRLLEVGRFHTMEDAIAARRQAQSQLHDYRPQ